MTGTAVRTIGGYEVESELAQGGMGVVYLARQPALERRVVLKTLRRELADDERVTERFEREARAAAAVYHENVVVVHDCFAWRGVRYIAQEYVDGVDLASALRSAPRFAPRLAALIALEVARGLEQIHARGIVHRDLKPSNVLIRRDGAVKIADFGIALEARGDALTETGHAVGTPLYMSPEQLLGERADARSDLFSLGAILYEMLTGHRPFADEEPGQEGGLVRRIEAGRYRAPRRHAPATPRALARLVRASLRARPRRRPASAAHVCAALERRFGAADASARRAEIADALWKLGVFPAREDETRARPADAPRERGPWQWAALAAALAAGLAVGTLAGGWIEVESPAMAQLAAVLEALRPPE
jgi:serine/threonine-protein kinase